MPSVSIQITRFVDDYQPGFVECSLTDAFGNFHLFIEKAPIVSAHDLWSTSTYPCAGTIECEVNDEWIDDQGNSLIRINTGLPWHIESTTGEHEFTVLASQVGYRQMK